MVRHSKYSSFLLLSFLLIGCSGSRLQATPRYVFIDGGAHKGETVEYFRNSAASLIHPWEIFCFEPVKRLGKEILERGNLTLIQKAIWVADESLGFFAGGNTSVASIYENEAVGDRKNVQVPAVDFSKWLKENFSAKDFVWVKLDIEGSEYRVLEKMLSDNSIEIVDVLFVEFHSIPDKQAESPESLLKQIRKKGIVAVRGNSNPNGNWFVRSQWVDVG